MELSTVEIITKCLEIIGTIAFAVSGALVGIERKMDILGITILGATTACGGGILRDVILGITPPASFVDPTYISIAIITSLIIFVPRLRNKLMKRKILFDNVLLIMDSLGLGIFVVVGISVAAKTDYGLFLKCFVGVITGVGGGVLRDCMADTTPFIFHKHFYASAAIIGAVITVLMWNQSNEIISMFVGTGIIFALRLSAAHYRWKLPRA